MNHRDFWYATYTLYSISETVENEEKLNDAASGSSGGDQGSSNRQLTMVSFLKPVLKQIIMAGKSMQLLKNLDSKDSEQSERSSSGQCLLLCICLPVSLSACLILILGFAALQMQRERVCTHCFWNQCSHDCVAKRAHQQTPLLNNRPLPGAW